MMETCHCMWEMLSFLLSFVSWHLLPALASCYVRRTWPEMRTNSFGNPTPTPTDDWRLTSFPSCVWANFGIQFMFNCTISPQHVRQFADGGCNFNQGTHSQREARKAKMKRADTTNCGDSFPSLCISFSPLFFPTAKMLICQMAA